MDYATLKELQHFLRIPDGGEDTEDDVELALAIAAASRAVDRSCNQVFGVLEAVPASVKLATLLQASRWFKRRDTPYGIAGSQDMGTQLRLFSKLDPDVAVLIVNEKNWWGAV